MRLLPTLLLAILSISSSIGQLNASTQRGGFTLPNTFRTEENTHYVMPSKQTFYGAVSAPVVRADSRYIAFIGDPNLHREIPNLRDTHSNSQNLGPKQSLYTFDLKTGILRTVTGISDQIQSIFFPGNSKLLWITTVNPETSIETHTLFNPETNTFATLPQTVSRFTWDVTPRILGTNLVVFPTESLLETTLFIYSLTEQKWVEKRVAIEPDRITDDGQNLLVFNAPTEVSEFLNAQPIGQINLQTGAVVPLNYTPGPTKQSPRFYVSYFGPVIQISGARSKFLGAFEDEPPPAPQLSPVEDMIPGSLLLTARGLTGGSTPDGKFAYYVEQSGLFISDIVTLNAQQIDQYAYDFVKDKVMSQAKQLGTGIAIYMADYDDNFPLAKDWDTAVAPYIRNNSLLKGANYLLNGENATKVENISELQMLIIDTPFGTAIVRGDTSVIWRDRPKPLTTKTLNELRS